MPDPRQMVQDLARRDQHGAILRSQALNLGMNVAQIERRVRRGQWLRGPVRSTFLLADSASDPMASLAAATLGLDAVAWGRSALALWGVTDPPRRPEVASAKRRRNALVTIRCVKNLDQLPLTNRQGVRTATLELGLASSASFVDTRGLHELIDQALRLQLTTWDRVRRTLEGFATSGRPGSAKIRHVLTARNEDAAIPLSQWSRDFTAKLVASGMPRPKMEWRIHDQSDAFLAQVDLAYPKHRYAIELDSRTYHLNSEAFETDRRRDAELSRQGWSVGRFTWNQYANEWDWVISVVASQLGIGR